MVLVEFLENLSLNEGCRPTHGIIIFKWLLLYMLWARSIHNQVKIYQIERVNSIYLKILHNHTLMCKSYPFASQPDIYHHNYIHKQEYTLAIKHHV